MSRLTVTDADAARTDLGSARSIPEWREGRPSLPFHELSPAEFEVFCFLLLLKEHPGDRIYYYGKTGDRGRDIIHRRGGKVRLIQCKRFTTGNVGIAEIREELAKLCAHSLSGELQEPPDEVVFYVVPDVTSDAADLITQQSLWRDEAPKALEAFLKCSPGAKLLAHAHSWWPEPEYVAALSLTERARKFSDLIEEFFGVRKVIAGTVADVEAVVRRELQPIKDAVELLRPLVSSRPTPPPLPPEPLDEDAVRRAFADASGPLLSWPTTLGPNRWLARAELDRISSRVSAEESSTTLLLGLPGSGKSALLAKLGQAGVDAQTTVLALKADQLSTSIDSLGSLSEQLRLPGMVTDCVRLAAASGKVLVLIDQLDALADLIDLRPGRLNALLTLVKELSGHRNVHIACSCRTFEYGHDIRLTSIEAEVTELAPLTWEAVSAVLRERGVDADHWPAECKKLLSTPQNLKVFLLRLQGTAEDQLFTTYQQLYDDLWRQRVLRTADGAERARLLMDMAERMADRETLWLPLAQFEEREGLVTALEAEDLLMLSENGRSVSFRHQTLFEHARARAFARGQGSLATHVLERQDGLFVRPLAWSTLHYLRGADEATYRREMEKLWRAPVRKHLRHLLIDFLGQVSTPPPSQTEQVWLLGYLQQAEYRNKVLAAIRGNPAWFDVLADVHLRAVMRLPANEAWPMAGILGAAWNTRRGTCLALLRQEWLPDPTKDRLSWSALEQQTEWDGDALDFGTTILRRSDVSPVTVMGLAARVAEDAPDAAIALVRTRLFQELERLEALPDPTPPLLPSDATETDRFVQRMTFDPRERFRRLLEHCQDWHGLPELAEAAPGCFVREMWPWFTRLLAHILRREERRATGYRRDSTLATNLSSHRGLDYLTEALCAAVREWARQEPAPFLAFLQGHQQSDSLFVQRLLCRGLRTIATTHPEDGLRFLTADPRRLVLGDLDDEHADTIDLVSAIAPHLTAVQAARLEQAILSWQSFARDDDLDAASRRYMLNCERERRLRLLTAIPEDRVSASTRALIRTEQQALPAYEGRGVRATTMTTVVSDMSAEQMGRARDDDVVNFLTVMVRRQRERQHNPFQGGMTETAHAFAQFAKAHPGRAGRIIPRLTPGAHDVVAGDGLRALSETDFPKEQLLTLALDLDHRGFGGEEFRVNVALAMGNGAREGVGLPDAVCAMLERWLGEPWRVPEAGEERTGEAADKEERVHPLLWQRGGMVTLPFGPYHLLRALSYGYLLREPPAALRWMSLLETQVERPIEVEAWRVFAHDLRDLRLCDPGRAELFLCRLFERYPGARDSLFGASLLTYVWWFLPQPTTRQLLQGMRDGGWREGPQAYGELLALRCLVFPDDHDAQQDLRQLLLPDGGQAETSSRIRTGLAFTAAELWPDVSHRAAATDILVRLIPLADRRVSRAIMHVFLRTDVLCADGDTERFLRTLHEHSAVLRGEQGSFFAERLQYLLSAYPDLVFDLCMDAARLWAEELDAARVGFASSTAQFTNMALMFQRLDGTYRAKGLDLFERLLDIGVHDAFMALQELDRRIPSLPAPVRRPIARRRPRRTSPA